MSRGVGCRCSWDLVLLWLGYKLAAVVLIRPLAWDPPYATGVALKKTKRPKKKKFRDKEFCPSCHSAILCLKALHGYKVAAAAPDITPLIPQGNSQNLEEKIRA